jgi:hypothetical protein
MGGAGSGCHYHWWRGTKKDVVEDCRTIDLGELARQGYLRAGKTGTIRWSRGGKETSSIGFTVRPGEETDLVLVLNYTLTQSGEQVEIPTPLETTRLCRGGLRWWGRCPLVVGRRPCERRIGKLYLPPGARYFGCRHCHGLTYTSCQESHQYDGVFRCLARDTGMDFETVKWAMNSIGKRRSCLS